MQTDEVGQPASAVLMTGSLVVDYGNRLAFANLSTRTHPESLKRFAQTADYDIIAVDARDRDGLAIYPNVMASLGQSFAVVCLEAIEGASAPSTDATCICRTSGPAIASACEYAKRSAINAPMQSISQKLGCAPESLRCGPPHAQHGLEERPETG